MANYIILGLVLWAFVLVFVAAYFLKCLDWVLIVFIGCISLPLIGSRVSLGVAEPWILLAFLTAMMFYGLAKLNRRLWNNPVFWRIFTPMLAAHAAVYAGLLSRGIKPDARLSIFNCDAPRRSRFPETVATLAAPAFSAKHWAAFIRSRRIK